MKIKKTNNNFKLKDMNFDNIYQLKATKDYVRAMNNEDFNEILEYICGCDFDIEINTDGTINLIDEQGAYLGGYDSYENFTDVFSACERLEGSFLCDYYGIY